MVTSSIQPDTTSSRIDPGSLQICNPPTNCIGCLAASALAIELTPDQLRTLFDKVEVRRLSKDEVLISEGDFDDHLYAVAKGKFEVSHSGARGEDSLIRIGRGVIVGELAFLDGLKRTASVKAVTDDCCVIVLRREELESLLSVDPLLVYRVMRAIVRSAHRTVGRMDVVYSDLMHYISG